jgi:hypothetical protein
LEGLSKRFGMSPADRARIDVGKVSEPDNLLEMILREVERDKQRRRAAHPLPAP